MSRKDCAPLITPAVTTLDSANISVINNEVTNNYSGNAFDTTDVAYLLASSTVYGTSSYATGTTINTVTFPVSWLQAPTRTNLFPPTSRKDFKFYFNGVLLEDSQILTFDEIFFNGAPAGCKAEIDISDSDGNTVVINNNEDTIVAIGKFA